MDSEKWFCLSYAAKVSNIGSEVERAIKWRKSGKEERSRQFYNLALEWLVLTKNDPKNADRIMELETAETELINYFDEGRTMSESHIMQFWNSQIESYMQEKYGK